MSGVKRKLRSHRDRVLAWLVLAGGACGIVIGWLQVSAAGTQQEQLSYLISGGFGGLLALGIGATLLLTADLHDLAGKAAELRSAGTEMYLVDARESGQVSPVRRMAALLLATWAVAVVVLGVAWNVAAQASDGNGAVPGISLAVLGLVICAAGGATTLTWLRHRIHVDKAVVIPAVAAWLPERLPKFDLTGPARFAEADSAARVASVLVGDGLRHFHRVGCPALMEISSRSVSRSVVPAELSPCGICEA